MGLESLFYWNTKTASDNGWHPRPGGSPKKYIDNLPLWAKRTDFEAACVDVAPFVAGAGGLAHLRQLNNLGWTAPASVFPK